MPVDGLDKLNKRFRELPNDTGRLIHDALDKGGAEVAAAAKVFVPEALGDLEDSIEHEIRPLPNDKGAQAIIRAGYAPDDPDTHDALGARQQEFGRAPGGAGVNSDHSGHAASPFMFPAYRLVKKRVVGRVKRAIKKAAKINNGG